MREPKRDLPRTGVKCFHYRGLELLLGYVKEKHIVGLIRKLKEYLRIIRGLLSEIVS